MLYGTALISNLNDQVDVNGNVWFVVLLLGARVLPRGRAVAHTTTMVGYVVTIILVHGLLNVPSCRPQTDCFFPPRSRLSRRGSPCPTSSSAHKHQQEGPGGVLWPPWELGRKQSQVRCGSHMSFVFVHNHWLCVWFEWVRVIYVCGLRCTVDCRTSEIKE